MGFYLFFSDLVFIFSKFDVSHWSSIIVNPVGFPTLISLINYLWKEEFYLIDSIVFC